MLPLFTWLLSPDATEFDPSGTVFVLPSFTPSVRVTPWVIWERVMVTANRVRCDIRFAEEAGTIENKVWSFMVFVVLKRLAGGGFRLMLLLILERVFLRALKLSFEE